MDPILALNSRLVLSDFQLWFKLDSFMILMNSSYGNNQPTIIDYLLKTFSVDNLGQNCILISVSFHLVIHFIIYSIRINPKWIYTLFLIEINFKIIERWWFKWFVSMNSLCLDIYKCIYCKLSWWNYIMVYALSTNINCKMK